MPTPSAHWCTIVVPCYNEAARLDTKAFLTFLESNPCIRFLFVNDGSSDATLEVLHALQSQRPDLIAVIDKKPNAGKGEAVRTGVLSAMSAGQSSFVGFWDADLATPLDAIPGFIDHFETNPELNMVFGSRVRLLGRAVHRKASRHYLGRVFATVVSTLLHLPIYDTQCGAKIFRSIPQMQQLFVEPFSSRWVFDVEILARLIRQNRGDVKHLEETIYEMPLERWEDVAGSKVRPASFFRAFLDVVRIQRRYLS